MGVQRLRLLKVWRLGVVRVSLFAMLLLVHLLFEVISVLRVGVGQVLGKVLFDGRVGGDL